jgi:hypothetical protein
MVHRRDRAHLDRLEVDDQQRSVLWREEVILDGIADSL